MAQGSMLPQTQPTNVHVPPMLTVPPGTTGRHLGDTLWPWFLGAVALAGVGFLVYKMATMNKTESAAPEEGQLAGKFKSAIPVKLKHPPMGFRRRTRPHRMSEREYTLDEGGGYNLEVED